MHDGMQYDPIQGQGQRHEPWKVGNSSIFKRYLFPHLQCVLANDREFLIRGQYLKHIGAGFFILVIVFVSRDFEVGSK